MRFIPARLWGLVLLSGVLQVLPFPIAGPVPLWRTAFCWIALLPLIAALCSTQNNGRPLTLRQGAYLGYACGIIWYLGDCYWIYQTMYLYGALPRPVAIGILLLFALYLGLYHALFATILVAGRRSRLGRQGALLLVPFAWVAVELARARITGFPWDLLGYAQVDNPLLIRLAPVTGVYGLTFIIAAVNAFWLVRISLRERRHTRSVLSIAGVLVIVLYILNLRRMEVPLQTPVTATATLVQENLGVGAASGPALATGQLIESFSSLSRNPAHTYLDGIPGLSSTRARTVAKFPYVLAPASRGYQPTDLIVWPESPSGFRTNDLEFVRAMHQLADSTHAPLIVGSLGVVPGRNPEAERPYFLYDSAAFFVPAVDAESRYDKIHLVPWGEYIPFKRFFFFANKLTAGVGDMDPGTTRSIFLSKDHKLGAFVCYESIFGDEVRQFPRDGAEVLVNISDDGWYGDTSAAWQHLNMVRMRAIENHRWILRSTNTGITAAINPYGRVTVAAPRNVRTAITASFGYEHDTTFYAAHGDLFAYLCALITISTLAYSILRPRAINQEASVAEVSS